MTAGGIVPNQNVWGMQPTDNLPVPVDQLQKSAHFSNINPIRKAMIDTYGVNGTIHWGALPIHQPSHTQNYDCTEVVGSGEKDMVICNSGSYCSKELVGWDCCEQNNDGPMRGCPLNFVMCNRKHSDGGHHCASTAVGCAAQGGKFTCPHDLIEGNTYSATSQSAQYMGGDRGKILAPLQGQWPSQRVPLIEQQHPGQTFPKEPRLNVTDPNGTYNAPTNGSEAVWEQTPKRYVHPALENGWLKQSRPTNANTFSRKCDYLQENILKSKGIFKINHYVDSVNFLEVAQEMYSTFVTGKMVFGVLDDDKYVDARVYLTGNNTSQQSAIGIIYCGSNAARKSGACTAGMSEYVFWIWNGEGTNYKDDYYNFDSNGNLIGTRVSQSNIPYNANQTVWSQQQTNEYVEYDNISPNLSYFSVLLNPSTRSYVGKGRLVVAVQNDCMTAHHDHLNKQGNAAADEGAGVITGAEKAMAWVQHIEEINKETASVANHVATDFSTEIKQQLKNMNSFGVNGNLQNTYQYGHDGIRAGRDPWRQNGGPQHKGTVIDDNYGNKQFIPTNGGFQPELKDGKVAFNPDRGTPTATFKPLPGQVGTGAAIVTNTNPVIGSPTTVAANVHPFGMQPMVGGGMTNGAAVNIVGPFAQPQPIVNPYGTNPSTMPQEGPQTGNWSPHNLLQSGVGNISGRSLAEVEVQV
jgi:hypothetical protein